MTTQPAGEHHTGNLDLTGEGNAPASVVSDDAVEDACRANWDSRVHASGCGVPWDDYAPAHSAAMDPYRDHMRAALEAAYPAIRQQVAEEIAGRERVLEILNAHQMHYAYGDDAACLCGWAPTHMRAWHSEHRDHTADMITREIGGTS